MANKGRNRSGSLYRRWQNKEYPIDDKATQGKGVIWLRYMLNGKMHKISLKTPNAEEAKQKQKEFMAPLLYADEKEALTQLAQKANQASEKMDVALENKNPPLSIAEAWHAYSESHERPDSGARTLKDYESHWKHFSEWLKATHPDILLLKNLTSTIASGYASFLIKEKFSPNTYNKRISFLRLLCATIAVPARLGSNPFEKIKSKKLKPDSKRELSQEELKTVLETATGDLQTLLYIGTFTGMRLGDCATLMWNEVDLGKNLIKRVPNKLKSRNGKPVLIGIPPILTNELSLVPTLKRKGYVLPELAKLYDQRSSDLTKKIQRHLEGCGIQLHRPGTGYEKVPDPSGKHEYLRVHTGKRAVVEVGFHSLRHTFVSLHAAYGTPQAVIMAIVGHGSPAMTHHYTHIGEATAVKAAGALEFGIQDAEFEEINPPVPKWVIEKLRTQTADNWESVRDEVVGGVG